MAKTNRTCKTCGKAYYYCPTCDTRKPSWFAMWETEQCRDIFKLLSSEFSKKITTSEAKQQLIDMGVTLNDSFTDSVKKHITRVFEYADETLKDNVANFEESVELEFIDEETMNENRLSIIPKKNKRKKISEEIEE